MNFADLKSEYDQLWTGMKVRPERAAAVDAIAHKLIAYQSRYEAVSKRTGVPWFVIAAWHNRESDADFSTQLAQGDPLNRVSVNEPTGRGPFATWEDGAYDALVTLKGLNKVTDWSPARICYETERYNGFGYRNYHQSVLSPYLWSFTIHYKSGKYTSDGHFDDDAVDKQCGAIPIIKRIMEIMPATKPASETSLWKLLGDAAAAVLNALRPVRKPVTLVERLEAAMKKHQYKLFTKPGELNIVYVTGMNLDGTANDNAPDKWNDLRCVFTYSKDGKPMKLGLWVATTEPGFYYGRERLLNKAGAFHLAPGQYTAWQVGFHRDDPDREAFVQTGDEVTGWRDGNRNMVRDDTDPIDVGYFGINQHDGQDGSPDSIGKHSAGCLVVRDRKEHRAFMALGKTDPRYLANKKFVFTTALLLAAEV